MKLSDTQAVILSQASQHEQRLAPLPKIPAAARNAVFRSMLKHGLLEEQAAPRQHTGFGWRQDDDGAWIALRITDKGLHAIGIDPHDIAEVDAAAPLPADAPPTAPAGGQDEVGQGAAAPGPEPAHTAPTSARRASLRDAAAVLAAWDDEGDQRQGLPDPTEALHRILAKPASMAHEPDAPRKPREGTKQAAVLAMLRRPEGATIAQICEATGWQQHTVRGFLTGLKKRQGIEVQVLERVRQVGPNKEGAKGSYTVYHVAR